MSFLRGSEIERPLAVQTSSFSGAVYPLFLIRKRHTYFNAALLLLMN